MHDKDCVDGQQRSSSSSRRPTTDTPVGTGHGESDQPNSEGAILDEVTGQHQEACRHKQPSDQSDNLHFYADGYDFRCPSCGAINDMSQKQLQNAKGFATLLCSKTHGGCGVRSSAIHWHCTCEGGTLKWYKRPVHSREQDLIDHRQGRKSRCTIPKSSKEDDKIPTIKKTPTTELSKELPPKKKQTKNLRSCTL